MKKLIKHWQNYPEIICATTTKRIGLINKNYITEEFYKILPIPKKQAIIADQVHGDKIALVSTKKQQTLIGIDGLLTKEKQLLLAIRTADCVPIFFYEPQAKIIGIVHAGWKGTYKTIAKKMVIKALKSGVNINELKVFIGPHIKSCCYEVNSKLANKFINKFHTKKIVITKKDKIKLDLEQTNIIQLLQAGIKKSNLKTSIYCTYCYSKLFHSYRRQILANQQLNEMISFILLK